MNKVIAISNVKLRYVFVSKSIVQKICQRFYFFVLKTCWNFRTDLQTVQQLNLRMMGYFDSKNLLLASKEIENLVVNNREETSCSQERDN